MTSAQPSAGQRHETLIVTVAPAVDVDEHTWAAIHGRVGAYDRARARPRRSLVADVEDYVVQALSDTLVAERGAILSMGLAT